MPFAFVLLLVLPAPPFSLAQQATATISGRVFNDFALQHEIQGRGFTALYQNSLETQVATVGLRVRF